MFKFVAAVAELLATLPLSHKLCTQPNHSQLPDTQPTYTISQHTLPNHTLTNHTLTGTHRQFVCRQGDMYMYRYPVARKSLIVTPASISNKYYVASMPKDYLLNSNKTTF